jgi:hypothetical protein
VNQESIWLELIEAASKGLVFRKIGPEDYLTGPNATIDSLDFLNFLVSLESLATERFGKFRPIVEEKNLDRILREAHQIKDLVVILLEL